MKLERFLLALFLFSIPFQSRIILAQWSTPFNEWTTAFLWGTDLLVIGLLILWMLTNPPYGRYVNKWLAVFLLCALVSIFNAILPAVSWYRWLKLAEYIFVFWYMGWRALNVMSLDTIARIVFYSAAFQALIGIFQYLFQHSIGLKILGESVLAIDMPGVAVVVANGERFLRAYGTFPHPNLLALWLVFGIWAFWYLSKKSKFLYFVYALILVALVLTFSRTVIAFWVIGSFFLFRKQFIKLSIFTVLVLAFTTILVLPQMASRARISVDDEGISQRVFFNKQAIESSRSHLIIGNGIGQFVPVLLKNLSSYPRYIYQPAHNVYLLVLNETGILGLLIFSIFLARIAWQIRADKFKIVIFLTICGISLLDHYPWTLQQGGLMFWGMLGILESQS